MFHQPNAALALKLAEELDAVIQLYRGVRSEETTQLGVSWSRVCAQALFPPSTKCEKPAFEDMEELEMRSASAPALGWSLKCQKGRTGDEAGPSVARLKEASEAPSRASMPGTDWYWIHSRVWMLPALCLQAAGVSSAGEQELQPWSLRALPSSSPDRAAADSWA